MSRKVFHRCQSPRCSREGIYTLQFYRSKRKPRLFLVCRQHEAEWSEHLDMISRLVSLLSNFNNLWCADEAASHWIRQKDYWLAEARNRYHPSAR